MFHPRSRLRLVALWLALTGVVLRGLVPAGFMPGWTQGAADGGRSWLMICPAGELQALLPQAAQHHHHAGMVMSGGMAAGEHEAHRIAEAHMGCPFAAAATPALPVSLAALSLAEGPLADDRTATSTRHVSASTRRLPPARGPPVLLSL